MNDSQILKTYYFTILEEAFTLAWTDQPDKVLLQWQDQKQEKSFSLNQIEEKRFHILVENQSYVVEILEWKENQFKIRLNGLLTFSLEVETDLERRLKAMGVGKAHQTTIKELKSPMPGLIKSILVQPGQEVEKGEPLLILEAMKMENVIKSPAPVTIAEILVQPNEAVEKNVVLIRFA
jgi:biotin carboxyl carrier protein